MYLAFKEKINSLRGDEFERARLFRKIEVALVATFWIAVSILGLVLGRQKDLRGRNLLEVPSVPKLSQVLEPQTAVDKKGQTKNKPVSRGMGPEDWK